MREIKTLEGISDGRIYDIEDKVEADAGGCNGCSACCHSVGDLVMLTPFDVYEMVNYLKCSFDELLAGKIELREKNKIQLPYLGMNGIDERCNFLNSDDRCSIHGFRPNICRLFPLGRIYENDSFKYFLQIGSCLKPNLSEVKVREWIGIADYEKNKAFILAWHQLIKALTFRLKFIRNLEEIKAVNEELQEYFYRIEVKAGEDFYDAFWRVLPEAKKELGII